MSDQPPPKPHRGPPEVPPSRTAVSSSGEPEDEFLRQVQAALEEAGRRAAQSGFESMVAPSSGDIHGPEFWQGVTAADEELLTLLGQADHMDPEEVQGLIALVERRRTSLAEQIELERLVRRPPKEGHLPYYADDELMGSYERTLAILDKILAALRSRAS